MALIASIVATLFVVALHRTANVPGTTGDALIKSATSVGARANAKDIVSPASAISGFAGLTARHANALERSADLNADYRRLESALTPFERDLAYRAWSACFPTFLSAAGQVGSVQNLIDAMPRGASSNALRTEAYQKLRQRCAGFFHLSSDELVQTTQRLDDMARRGDAASVGELAFKFWREGDEARARDLARASIISRDGYSIASLQEYVHRSLERRIDEGSFAKTERSDLRALALAIAACEYGLDCSADSLTALQLCTNNAQCEGALPERYLQRLDTVEDRQRLQALVRETIAAIQSNDFAKLGFDAP
ncbi:MAG: hypothetical protein EAZ30_06200 [Betaproteobacteria bacterium]|nr:MAG: hypothetical protein EAZ30_06200 [Betaproteobacteria bacterium]